MEVVILRSAKEGQLPMKILIVEDEPKTGAYLRQGLIEAGFVVDLARNGPDGLHLALGGNYDLAILDVMMPGMSGWEVLQAIRHEGLQVPAMFLTARDQVEDRVKGLELGADDYLVKPFPLPSSWPEFAPLCAAVLVAPNPRPCRWQTSNLICYAAASPETASALILPPRSLDCWNC